MELEELSKKIEWLDSQRRKDKTTISSLENKLTNMEGTVKTLQDENKQLSNEVARLTAGSARFEQLENSIGQARVEFGRQYELAEKTRIDREKDTDKIRRADMEANARLLGEVKKALDAVADVKKSLQSRIDEDFRLAKLIEECNARSTDALRMGEEYDRARRIILETQRQDTKKVSDNQAEIASMRKRLEEQRGRMDLSLESIRKLEIRLTEFQAAESERRQNQTAFIERHSLLQVERDRIWKEWEQKFAQVEKESTEFESLLVELEGLRRSLKHSQDGFDDITQRFERRINEISEMQRLSDDRFRQEWTGFKGDDQKRWTNYTLSQEEIQKDFNNQLNSLMERVIALEDLSQELSDLTRSTNASSRLFLTNTLSLMREWIDSIDRNTEGN